MKDKDTVILRIGLLAQGSQPYLEYKTIKSTDDIGATIYEETEKIQITSLGIKTLEDDHQQHIEYWKNFFIKSFATPIIVAIITSILTIYTSKVLGWLL
ncbi:hypothetical protein [Veillonella magna]|nr:hypothetical protein [Veillonella magna]